MNQNNGEKLPPNQPYYGQPPHPVPFNASAPTEFPTPPPQYSVSEPSFPQQPYAPYAPFLQQQQQQPPILIQQPQQPNVVVHQIPC